MKRCIDVFAGLGGFSQAFETRDGWDVTTVDIEDRFNPDVCEDVLNLTPSDLPNADVILASPPCTTFSMAGNHDLWTDRTPKGDAKEAVLLVYHTLGLIEALNPDYWFLENPKGRLRWVIGEPRATVHYCQYGKDYKKPTDLWGVHPAGMEYRTCSQSAGSGCHVRNGANELGATASMPRDPAKRAKIPLELSKSVLESVENRHNQTTLKEVNS